MNPLLQIVGRLMTDNAFATALQANPAAALSSYGYTLTPAQMTIASNIAASLQQGRLTDGRIAVNNECQVWPCNMMAQTLWQVLGDMLVHSSFREAMKADRAAALSERGYVLTPSHDEIAARMVASFQSGAVNNAVANVASECPVWPCNDPLMA